MADSFAGVSFDVLSEPLERTQDSLVSVRKVPYGDVTIVDLGGRLPRQLTLRLLVANANLASLESKVNEQGSLVYDEGTFTAVLQRVTRQTREWDPAAGAFLHTVSAEFILV